MEYPYVFHWPVLTVLHVYISKKMRTKLDGKKYASAITVILQIYKLFNPSNENIVISKDADFDEEIS
jgi:hypothetical protein